MVLSAEEQDRKDSTPHRKFLVDITQCVKIISLHFWDVIKSQRSVEIIARLMALLSLVATVAYVFHWCSWFFFKLTPSLSLFQNMVPETLITGGMIGCNYFLIYTTFRGGHFEDGQIPKYIINFYATLICLILFGLGELLLLYGYMYIHAMLACFALGISFSIRYWFRSERLDVVFGSEGWVGGLVKMGVGIIGTGLLGAIIAVAIAFPGHGFVATWTIVSYLVLVVILFFILYKIHKTKTEDIKLQLKWFASKAILLFVLGMSIFSIIYLFIVPDFPTVSGNIKENIEEGKFFYASEELQKIHVNLNKIPVSELGKDYLGEKIFVGTWAKNNDGYGESFCSDLMIVYLEDVYGLNNRCHKYIPIRLEELGVRAAEDLQLSRPSILCSIFLHRIAASHRYKEIRATALSSGPKLLASIYSSLNIVNSRERDSVLNLSDSFYQLITDTSRADATMEAYAAMMNAMYEQILWEPRKAELLNMRLDTLFHISIETWKEFQKHYRVEAKMRRMNHGVAGVLKWYYNAKGSFGFIFYDSTLIDQSMEILVQVNNQGINSEEEEPQNTISDAHLKLGKYLWNYLLSQSCDYYPELEVPINQLKELASMDYSGFLLDWLREEADSIPLIDSSCGVDLYAYIRIGIGNPSSFKNRILSIDGKWRDSIISNLADEVMRNPSDKDTAHFRFRLEALESISDTIRPNWNRDDVCFRIREIALQITKWSFSQDSTFDEIIGDFLRSPGVLYLQSLKPDEAIPYTFRDKSTIAEDLFALLEESVEKSKPNTGAAILLNLARYRSLLAIKGKDKGNPEKYINEFDTRFLYSIDRNRGESFNQCLCDIVFRTLDHEKDSLLYRKITLHSGLDKESMTSGNQPTFNDKNLLVVSSILLCDTTLNSVQDSLDEFLINYSNRIFPKYKVQLPLSPPWYEVLRSLARMLVFRAYVNKDYKVRDELLNRVKKLHEAAIKMSGGNTSDIGYIEDLFSKQIQPLWSLMREDSP